VGVIGSLTPATAVIRIMTDIPIMMPAHLPLGS